MKARTTPAHSTTLDRALESQLTEAFAPLAQLEVRLRGLDVKLKRLRALQVEIANDLEAISEIVR